MGLLFTPKYYLLSVTSFSGKMTIQRTEANKQAIPTKVQVVVGSSKNTMPIVAAPKGSAKAMMEAMVGAVVFRPINCRIKAIPQLKNHNMPMQNMPLGVRSQSMGNKKNIGSIMSDVNSITIKMPSVGER